MSVLSSHGYANNNLMSTNDYRIIEGQPVGSFSVLELLMIQGSLTNTSVRLLIISQNIQRYNLQDPITEWNMPSIRMC